MLFIVCVIINTSTCAYLSTVKCALFYLNHTATVLLMICCRVTSLLYSINTKIKVTEYCSVYIRSVMEAKH